MNDKQVKIKGALYNTTNVYIDTTTEIIARHQTRQFINIIFFLGYYELDEITHILLIGERKLITVK